MPTERVHIVDDDSEIRGSLAFLLESEGLEVACYDTLPRCSRQQGPRTPAACSSMYACQAWTA
ncbi:MAG: hypothetical protein ACLFMS_08115 [Halorhodospira sp.]